MCVVFSMQEFASRICSLPDDDEWFLEEVLTPILDSVENPMHLKNLSVEVSSEAFKYFSLCAYTSVPNFFTHRRTISAGTETVI